MVGLLIAGGGGAAALAMLIWALSLRRRLEAEQRARAGAERLAAARESEIAHLAAVRAPAIAERTRTGRLLDGVPGPVGSDSETGADFARALAAVVTALGSDEAVRRERALRDSVRSALESVARTVHAMATAQQEALDRVERSLDDPRLTAEVIRAGHAAARMNRRAQTLLVLCGSWPVRRERRPVSLHDCVHGARSRIVEFGRVDVHGGQTLHVAPPAVEGLVHVIAELLENATVFSPSGTPVAVTVREVAAGAVVEIDDAGLGMPPDVLAQAAARLRDEPDLARLGAVPRLGLACAGRWSRELGFSVELTAASSYGGTRAVTFVPHRLLTDPPSRPAPLRHEPAAGPRAPGHEPSRPAAGEGEPHPQQDGQGPAVQGTAGTGPVSGSPAPGRAPVSGSPAPGSPVSGFPAPGGGPAPAGGPAPPPGGLRRRRGGRGEPDAAEPDPEQSSGAPSPPDPGGSRHPETPPASVPGAVSGTHRGRAPLGSGVPAPDEAGREGGRP
ncbi:MULTISPECIES: ATP-binding protein [unclassified Streptomyces]|uniref:ATP-binding protein n=1 Tax=unclassified Streptomyces TaxID=2593676 RepID=UPI000F45A41D|nr:ATP-binding protein [Streptomyces sp. I6]RNL70110.1 ATP-binding protein [Streptomyces sp. I6]